MDADAHGKFSFYMAGWRHGASLQAQDSRRANHPQYGAEYLQGHEDGSRARSETTRKASSRYGYHPHLLKDITEV
jgi:hypothetical protein